MDVVIDQLQQEPHHIPQDEGGDQIPVDDVPETPYAPAWARNICFIHVDIYTCDYFKVLFGLGLGYLFLRGNVGLG